MRWLLAGLLAMGLAGTAGAEEKEPPITATGGKGVFLRAVHERLHAAWVGNILRNAVERLPEKHPLNDRKLSAIVHVTLISDGTVFDVQLERSSGAAEFDAAAVGLFAAGDQLAAPPDEVLSDDHHTYLRWTFARDARACSGVSVVLKEAPLDEAVPHLLSKRRDREVLRRVRAAALSNPDLAIGVLARFWLERAFELSSPALSAAIGLAALGDPRGADVMREALGRNERVAEVNAALARLKLKGGRPPAATPAAPGPTTAALVAQLRKGDRARRLEAAKLLATRFDGAARQALAGLTLDRDPELRFLGAASLDVRARAAVIEAVGDAGHDAYLALVQGPARSLGGEWLLSQLERLPPSMQSDVLAHWLWTSRAASPVTLSVRSR